MAPRRKRVIESFTPSPEPQQSSVVEDDAEGEDEAMDVDEVEEVEEDAEGEEEEEEEEEIEEEEEMEEEDDLEDDEDGEGEEEQGDSGPSSQPSDELDPEGEADADAADEYLDEDPELLPKGTTSRTKKTSFQAQAQPSSALKIKLNVKGKGRPSSGPGATAGDKRPSRAAARKSSKRTKMVAKDADLGSEDDFGDFDDEIDELDSRAGSSRRSLSPTKMTARQRAKGNKDLQETLLKLPQSNETSSKKLILTEAERIQRREEVARRRKRQTEQKLQDEQDQTINRLLRAQTGRSRAKLDVPSPADDGTPGTGSRYASPSRRLTSAPRSDMIRWVSSIADDKVVLRVAAPTGREEWINLAPLDTETPAKVQPRDTRGTCAVKGCKEGRKYRSVKRFGVGGCCLEHLKAVEKSLA